MTEQEINDIIEKIKNHIKKYDKESDVNNNNWKWCAGITDNPEEKKKLLESKAIVSYFEKWELATKKDAIELRNKLQDELGFQPFVLEKSNTTNITKFSELNNSYDEKVKEDLKFVIVFKNQ